MGVPNHLLRWSHSPHWCVVKKYNGLPSRLHTIPIAALLTTNNIIDYPCIHGANIKNCSSSRTNILTYKQYNMKIEGGMTSKTHPYLLQMWPLHILQNSPLFT